MPQQGPEGEPAYLPHEAYSVIGQQLYGEHWSEGYAGRASVPYLTRAKQLAQMKSERGEVLRKALARGDDAYDATQRKRYREAQAFESLFTALKWGKTHASYRAGDSEWRSVKIKNGQTIHR